MENTELKSKKRQAHPDRVVLDKESMEVVNRISAQIGEAFGGMIKLTNREVSNFLIQKRSDNLSSAELKDIKEKYFDDVRAAQWAVQKLKQAKNGGENLSLNEVLQMLQSPIVKEKRNPHSNPKTKPKKLNTPPAEESASTSISEFSEK